MIIEIVVFSLIHSETVKDPPPPFSQIIDILYIDYSLNAYNFNPLIMLLYRDKMKIVIMVTHCSTLRVLIYHTICCTSLST